MADAIIKNIDTTVDKALTGFLKPGIVKGVVNLLLALYAVRFAPELPTAITNLFTNQYVRLFVFALILWTARFSPSTAIMIALAFMVTVNVATNKPIWEFLENIENQQLVESQMMEQPEGAMSQEAPSEMQAPSEIPDSGCYPTRRYDMSKVTGFEESAM